MKPVFADTFFFLALLNRHDPGHEAAVEASRSLKRHRMTTAWVLTEVGDALALGKGRDGFLDLMKFLRRSPLVTVIPPSQELFDRGIELYAKRRDKDWPLTDCISFVVMTEEGLSDALTGDQHFEQAGFKILL